MYEHRRSGRCVWVIPLFLLHVIPVSAEGFPRSGSVQNIKEVRSLSFKCRKLDTETIECDFLQSGVRPQAESVDLQDKLSAARKEYRAGVKPPSKDECSLYQTMVDTLEGRLKPPRPEGLSELSPVAKKDALAIAKAGSFYCEKPSEDNYLRLIRLAHEKETRTCLVHSTSYTGQFQLMRDTGVWVSASEPEGRCGIVYLERFEPETTSDEFTFWNYVIRKNITNPKGTYIPGVGCSELDESEQQFVWRNDGRALSCDYIKFSPL